MMRKLFRTVVLIAALGAASQHGAAQSPDLLKQAAAANGGGDESRSARPGRRSHAARPPAGSPRPARGLAHL